MKHETKIDILTSAFDQIYLMTEEIKHDWDKTDYDRYIAGVKTLIAIEQEIRVQSRLKQSKKR